MVNLKKLNSNGGCRHSLLDESQGTNLRITETKEAEKKSQEASFSFAFVFGRGENWTTSFRSMLSRRISNTMLAGTICWRPTQYPIRLGQSCLMESGFVAFVFWIRIPVLLPRTHFCFKHFPAAVEWCFELYYQDFCTLLLCTHALSKPWDLLYLFYVLFPCLWCKRLSHKHNWRMAKAIDTLMKADEKGHNYMHISPSDKKVVDRYHWASIGLVVTASFYRFRGVDP